MFSYNAMGTYILVVTLATVFVIILVVRQQRKQKDIAIWAISGLVGILLGAAGAAAVVQAMGYDLAKRINQISEEELAAIAAAGAGEDTGMGGGMGMMGMGTGGPGGGMGMGGGMGGRSPSPKRQLTTLVRKVDLLTSDIALNLSDEQASGLVEILGRMKSQETMTDDDATALHEELVALFNDDQKANQEAIGLPFRRGGPGRGEQEQDANPFAQERNAEAMQALLDRFGEPLVDGPAPNAAPKETTTEKPAADAAPDETTTEKPATAEE
jgi:hypothetical protein